MTEAVIRIFDRQEWLRINRARARIKVLIDKIGIDEFRELVEDELSGDWVSERDFSLDRILFVHDEDDMHIPLVRTQEMLAGIDDAKLFVTQGLGHFKILKDRQVIDRIVTFLEQDCLDPA